MTTSYNYRILVIDDIPAIHDDFRKILTPPPACQALDKMNEMLSIKQAERKQLPPFEITSAYQGTEGIAYIRQALAEHRPFAVAFVDVRMPPGIDGVEAIQQIWSEDSDLQIVICTAYAKYSWDDLIERFGETDRLFVLKKPFDTLEVIQLASSLANKWNLSKGMSKKEEKPVSNIPSNSSTMGTLKETVAALESIKKQLKGYNLQPPKEDKS